MLCIAGETKWKKKDQWRKYGCLWRSPFVSLRRYQNSSAVLSLRTMCSVEEFGRRFGAVVSAATGAYSLG